MRIGSLKLPVESFSATSLSKAINCPEQWRRRYLLHEKESYGIERFIGSVDHETWEENFKWKLDLGKDMGMAMLASTYTNTFERLEGKDGVEWEDGQRKTQIEHGAKMIAAYYETAKTYVHPIAVEKRFEEKIPGVPVPLIGYVDVETEAEIIERKTAATKLSKPKSGWQFQGRIYQLVIDKPVNWHIVTKQVKPQVVTGNEVATLNLFQSNKDATVRLIQQTVHQINDYYQRYGADSPWPTNGIFGDWLCNYCQFGPKYANDCPAWGPNVL